MASPDSGGAGEPAQDPDGGRGKRDHGVADPDPTRARHSAGGGRTSAAQVHDGRRWRVVIAWTSVTGQGRAHVVALAGGRVVTDRRWPLPDPDTAGGLSLRIGMRKLLVLELTRSRAA